MFSDVDDLVAQGIGHGVRVGVWGARFRGDRLGSSGVVGVEDLVDALAADVELGCDFRGTATLVAYGPDDGHVAVGTVHVSNMSRLTSQRSPDTVRVA